ncbi:MAG: hypothetical protein ACREST_01610 [Steroidobacteraceae bacterium]
MTRIPVAIAALLAAIAAGAQDIPFVPGQGSADRLTDTERAAALAAIDALAAELQVPEDRIQVDTIRAVEWPDSSIGCPKPGRAYLQVITPGHKVTLRADGQVYVVHEARNEAFVCKQSKALGGITPERELIFGRQMAEARKDLSGRIGVSEEDIEFVSGVGTNWADASMGCPEPGVQYAQARVFGWVLTFRHGNRLFSYHTDLNRTIPCPPISAD